MLSLPEKYKKDVSIAKVIFVRGANLSGADKKRFETAVKEIRLTYQIEGFDIPNLVNDEYNCQVIMFMRIQLKSLKQAAFIAKVVQRCIAPLCVVQFTDEVNEQYSFADKRLNKQNQKEIVIENEYLTEQLPTNCQSNLKTLFSLYIDYETILNKNNKHTYYVEMMTKAFLVFNQAVYSGSLKILDSRVWHDEEKAMCFFPLLKKLKSLKQAAAKANTIAEKSAYNKEMKEIITQIEEIYMKEDG